MSSNSPPPAAPRIKEDPFAFKDVEYPKTPDAKFLAEVLGASLTKGLAEVAEKRPNDPIEYLAQYLYCYRDNCEYYEQQAELTAKVSEEMEEFEREQARQARLRDEARASKERAKELEKQQKESENQLREEDERKIRDSLLRTRPELPTLQEDEEEEQLRARDEWGQTQLHLLAGKEGSELHALLQQGYNISDRDLNGKTPRDHAKDSEIKENVDLIDEYVLDLFNNEKSAEILQLVMNGYLDQFPDLSGLNPSEEMKQVIDSMPALKDRVSAMFEAVASGNLAKVKETLDRKAMVYAKNIKGQSALHVAVLKNHVEVVKYLINQYPGTVMCKDNLSRQPLHYAYAVSEDLVTLLLEHKADKDAEDAKKKLPVQYAGQLADIEG